jgi:predicted nucleotide-binding protein/uncharacterized protein YjbI with pentapeptide repeats
VLAVYDATVSAADENTGLAADRRAVMVIYGHDTQANTALFDWLRAIGLRPREWSHLIQASGSASPYIGQVLDRALRDVQAVVAFFTPDERVTSARQPGAGRLQARPNVLIEAGMALVSHPDRTVIVVLGNQELPSDLAGRHYVRLRPGAPTPLADLAGRLRDAGCLVDTTGADWLDPARFPDRDAVSASAPQPAGPAGATSRDPAHAERYATAAAQLAQPNPAVRIAGAYAMALLADDWPARRQDCTDVLCTAVRTQPTDGVHREARDTIIRLIRNHLLADDSRSPAHADWSGCDFDFSGAELGGAQFNDARFSGSVQFHGARFGSGANFGRTEFSGRADFPETQFSDGATFGGARFNAGIVYFNSARFPAGAMSFHRARFEGAAVTFAVAQVTGGNLLFNEAEFTDGSLDFSSAELRAGAVRFDRASFAGGRVAFSSAYFTGAQISFTQARFTAGTVDFTGARLDAGAVGFGYARFDGGTVRLDTAEFRGADVNLSVAATWTTPPVLPAAAAPSTGLRLPAALADGRSGADS